jgi:hypothetical protein
MYCPLKAVHQLKMGLAWVSVARTCLSFHLMDIWILLLAKAGLHITTFVCLHLPLWIAMTRLTPKPSWKMLVCSELSCGQKLGVCTKAVEKRGPCHHLLLESVSIKCGLSHSAALAKDKDKEVRVIGYPGEDQLAVICLNLVWFDVMRFKQITANCLNLI